jgi:hypothetical protein
VAKQFKVAAAHYLHLQGSPSMEPERPLDPFVKEAPERGDITDERLVQLLEHWRALDADRTTSLPSVALIAPEQLRFILGWLMIMEPLDGGADFRYRLYGSSIALTTGRDLTGQKLSDSFPSFAAWAGEVYRSVMARHLPVLTRHQPRRYVRVDRWERLILPFAGRGGAVERLLVGAVVIGERIAGETVRLPWPLTE